MNSCQRKIEVIVEILWLTEFFSYLILLEHFSRYLIIISLQNDKRFWHVKIFIEYPLSDITKCQICEFKLKVTKKIINFEVLPWAKSTSNQHSVLKLLRIEFKCSIIVELLKRSQCNKNKMVPFPNECHCHWCNIIFFKVTLSTCRKFYFSYSTCS